MRHSAWTLTINTYADPRYGTPSMPQFFSGAGSSESDPCCHLALWSGLGDRIIVGARKA